MRAFRQLISRPFSHPSLSTLMVNDSSVVVYASKVVNHSGLSTIISRLSQPPKMMARVSVTSALIASALLLGGCDGSHNSAEPQAVTVAEPDLDTFIGCYTVSHDEPAQIKISQSADKLVMQMKEPARSKRVWDDPEPLEMVPTHEVRTFFSIDPDNVDAMIARPDRVLVLAHVKSVYANIDPLLDSQYLSYIYKGANTIYKVDCDDINTDILVNPHANMMIE
ncbi:MAG: hypothetical protein Q4P13_10345 [Psychrobacter sp.]|nr:hypothetical protein [Psychrobacter sp.]